MEEEEEEEELSDLISVSPSCLRLVPVWSVEVDIDHNALWFYSGL